MKGTQSLYSPTQLLSLHRLQVCTVGQRRALVLGQRNRGAAG